MYHFYFSHFVFNVTILIFIVFIFQKRTVLLNVLCYYLIHYNIVWNLIVILLSVIKRTKTVHYYTEIKIHFYAKLWMVDAALVWWQLTCFMRQLYLCMLPPTPVLNVHCMKIVFVWSQDHQVFYARRFDECVSLKKLRKTLHLTWLLSVTQICTE